MLYLYLLLLCGCNIPLATKDMDLENLTAPEESCAKKAESMQTEGLDKLRISFSSGEWQGNIWNHELLAVLPERTVCKETAILLVANNTEPEKLLPILREWSTRTQCPAATLSRIPNQPFFGRSEGDLMAFSFSNYLETLDPSWPLVIPMTRAIRTALTMLQQGLPTHPSRFVLVGSSKRAWASYLSAASDNRVVGLAGLAFNALNFTAQFNAMGEAGGSPLELNTYKALGLLTDRPSQALQSLYDLIDPYSYKTRLSQPIFVISGTNDTYWAIDAWRHFLSELPSAISLMVPNTGHDPLENPIARESLSTWLAHIASRTPIDKSTYMPTSWYLDPSTSEHHKAVWSQHVPKTAKQYLELEITNLETPFGTLSSSLLPALKQRNKSLTESTN